ncbi:hypothetical protein [Nostoc sp. 'Peltigera membranacea cyanobiont' 232]|uniref:hypothetical protein n=1 Tax=Nostoc sp. 'Peltigera membranacea cyanobiont' 232 TaxID=2014531 RepID=UPI000B951FD9|nr:hypothetical protein [Nostoc sp. 'Peltigera membranacea cyanobiont' 232]OYE00234.1 hypothetical protein CDG79_36320 [Nostoc sp. 'Peltigera membranacea cyanobiont' 232]
MDMQSLLTLAIVVIFWAFVTLVMFQFINGLFVSADYASNMVLVSNGNIAASTIPSVSETITTQARTFEKLPDPWTLENEVVHCKSNEAVILSFPTLRLLPPVKEISPQPKRTTRSNKANNAANKSPKTKKADVNSSGKRKPGSPRKIA